MPVYLFVWTSKNLAHLDENAVTPEEFEEIVSNPEVVDVSRASGRPIAFGTASTGRSLACVYEMLDELTVLPITAFEIVS